MTNTANQSQAVTPVSRGMSGAVSFLTALAISIGVVALAGFVAANYSAALIIGVAVFGPAFLTVALGSIVLVFVALGVAGAAAAVHNH